MLVGTVILLWNRRLRREVTERKRAEESLGRSEAKYRRLYESITDVIVTMDMAGGSSSLTRPTVRCFRIFGQRTPGV